MIVSDECITSKQDYQSSNPTNSLEPQGWKYNTKKFDCEIGQIRGDTSQRKTNFITYHFIHIIATSIYLKTQK